MDTRRNKGCCIKPDMINKQFVKKFLHIFNIVIQPEPFGREINVCGKEEYHAQIPAAGCQVIIGIKGIKDRQRQKCGNEYESLY